MRPRKRQSDYMVFDGPQPYTFLSSLVRQAVDSAGIVHDTCESSGYHRRMTLCQSSIWHLVEPIMVVMAELHVTTCLQCIGARHGVA